METAALVQANPSACFRSHTQEIGVCADCQAWVGVAIVRSSNRGGVRHGRHPTPPGRWSAL